MMISTASRFRPWRILVDCSDDSDNDTRCPFAAFAHSPYRCRGHRRYRNDLLKFSYIRQRLQQEARGK
uniref:Uncharacterized protein n=1 Tax=Ixodes ricinus TaxID=34613 RepID=A0A6B0U1Q4_IXORI